MNNLDNSKKYRLNARNLFLTYPNCNLPLNEVLSQLKIKCSNYIVKDYVIVREYHSDGTPHIHVYLNLHKPLNTINPNYLDLKSGDILVHGRYESTKSPNNVIEYILKHVNDKFSENIIFSTDMSVRIDKIGTYTPVDVTILNLVESGDIKGALDLYKKEYPKLYLSNHQSLEKSFRQLYLKNIGFTSKFNFKDFNVPNNLMALLKDECGPDNKERKTLVLIGQPGTGKTEMIEAYVKDVLKGNPLIINNLDGLRFFNPDLNNVIIFDDCSWNEDIIRENLLKLVDSQKGTTHNIKHGTVWVPNPTWRVVFLCPFTKILRGVYK